MTVETSAWRANDSARFDLARDAVSDVVALLLDLARQGALESDAAIEEARALRRDLIGAGFDRSRVDELLRDVEARSAELEDLRR